MARDSQKTRITRIQQALLNGSKILNDPLLNPNGIDGLIGQGTEDAVMRAIGLATGLIDQPIRQPDPAPILALLRKYESEGAAKSQGVTSPYDVVWGGISPIHFPQSHGGKRLTELTIQEVLDWQDAIDPLYPSEAAGAYQFMEDTLRGMDVNRWALFDAPMQDELALKLMNWPTMHRGTVFAAAKKLAQTWASIPVIVSMRGASRRVVRGQSYYAGDGLNKAHCPPEEVEAVLAAALVP